MKRTTLTGEPAPGVREAAGWTGQPLSRRGMMLRTAATVPLLPLVGSLAGQMSAQTPQGSGRGGQSAPAGPPRAYVVQGGTGPLRVLLITGGHPFARDQFFSMFDSFGKEITWTHVEHPAAQVFFNPALAEAYDVFVLFDMIGRTSKTGPSGSEGAINLEPSPALKKGMKALLQKGKGLVLFHHAVGSWVRWPEYHEVVGAASEFAAFPGLPLKVRGKEYAYSPNRVGVEQHISIADKTHPIVQGLGEGFDIVDEVFMHPVFEDSVHPLLRTDFKRIDSNFPRQYAQGWRHPEGSSFAAWYKASERSPVVYLQFGHDAKAWDNPAFRTLMMNSMRWAGSKEALAWAAANRTKIFK
jgi:uncharacterized protein